MTTVRWRHSPSQPEKLQSHARVLRWSDGSLTLQLATDPTAQYQMSAKPLAPPQVDPPKPVPMAAARPIKSKAGTNGTSGYDAKRDTFSYLAEPSEAAYVLRVTRHFTTALDIKPNSKTESLESLQVQMSAAVSKYQSTFANAEDGGAAAMIATGGSGLKIEDIRDDPEKLKKEALKQEREMERKIRKEERDREKNMKVGRATGRFGGVGLSMEGLEGESGAGGGRRGRGTRGGIRGARSRRDEFSEEEEEMYGRRGGPEDQYDMDDGFLASDDEDDDETGGSEDAEGEEDIDDVIERQEKQQKAAEKKKPGGPPAGNVSPKRRADNEDAIDAGQDSPLARAKRRRVVDSEDESE
jgi:RNA polymerase-associated protein LEO1